MGQLKKMTDLIWKYRYALMVVLVGLLIMLIPSNPKDAEAPSQDIQTQQPDLQQSLVQILGNIRGVGKVEVMLTVQTGQTTVFQTENGETVIITNGERAQEGLIQKVESPVFRGAVVVCQGADSPAVRLSVVEAVSAVTGLGADRIIVLKMK